METIELTKVQETKLISLLNTKGLFSDCNVIMYSSNVDITEKVPVLEHTDRMGRTEKFFLHVDREHGASVLRVIDTPRYWGECKHERGANYYMRNYHEVQGRKTFLNVEELDELLMAS